MEQISTYNIPAGLDALLGARERGALPRDLYEPMQALVRHFTAMAAERPLYAYLFADDDDAERRDLFAYALLRTLIQHIPSALLVDCDFLDAGMHGIVPEKDALGFLDYLLYGSSLGVITQQTTGGVHVIGPGSFPVTRKMPFVATAFREAAGRLANHARCVVFAGPLHDDDGNIHPLVGMAHLPVLVSGDGRGGTSIASVEESVVSVAGGELLSVRIGGVPTFEPDDAAPEFAGSDAYHETPPPADEPPTVIEAPPEPLPAAPVREPKAAPPPPPSPEPRPEAPVPPVTPEPVRPLEAPDPTPARPTSDAGESPAEPRYTSLVPRILTAFVALLVIAFIAWWFLEERTRPRTATPGPPAQSSAVPDADMVAAADSTPAQALTDTVQSVPAVTMLDAGVETPPTADGPPSSDEPPATAVSGPGPGPLSADDIHVMAELTDSYVDWYVIHVSSFRESGKAREETGYLTARRFPMFILFLDLGAKGKWYRIYCGPFQTREEARDVKKNLDDIERVRFTRISKVTR